MRFLLAPLLLLAAACSTLGGLTRLDEMTDAEFARYSERAAVQFQAVAGEMLRQGDLTEESALAVANAIRTFAEGSAAGALSGLAGHVDLEGYGALALTLTLSELDARLDDLGAYSEDGILSERGRMLLVDVADGLNEIAQPDGE